MELLGVTASVIGIVGFAIKGLEIIGVLREFCAEFSKEGTNDFISSLDQSARILDEVKTLCEKIDRLFPNRSSDFRIASLQVQVEDCTRDLQQLLAATEQRGSSGKFHVFKDFLDKASKNRASWPRERFRLHQENMKTALAITGRCLDAENSVQLHLVGDGVQMLSDRLSNDREDTNKTLQSLSSSGSAVLALSRSTSDRLQDVQCNTDDIATELRDMKELLLEVLSNSSSSVSSCHEERHPGEQCQNQERSHIFGNAKKDPHKRKFRRRSSLLDFNHGKMEPGDDHSDDEHHQQKANEKYDVEFNMALRVSKGLAKTVHRMYHPFLADYACTLYAWHTNETCARLIKLELPTGSWAGNFDGQATSRKVQDVRQRAQTQILTLRKVCIAEGLRKDLGVIDAGMNISQSVFEAWEEEEANRQRSSQRLFLTALDAPMDQKKDRLTRLNEWLLQVRESHQYLIQLHKDICFSQTNKGTTPKSNLFLKNWDRITLKYWFLDSAAMTTEDYAASSLTGGDSEATFKPLEDDDGVSRGSEKDLDEAFEITEYLLLQPQDLPVTIDGDDAYLQSSVESPASDFELEVFAAAQKAIDEYNELPAAKYRWREKDDPEH